MHPAAEIHKHKPVIEGAVAKNVVNAKKQKHIPERVKSLECFIKNKVL